MRLPGVRTIGLAAGAALAAALLVTACGGGDAQGTPTPFSLGGDSRVVGVTPTPTAGRPPTRAPKPTATAAATATPGGPTAPPPTGGAAAGRDVFLNSGCTACHTIDSIPQARGSLGPNLTTVGAHAGDRKPGISADAYLRESVTTPGAFIVQGFQNVMPPGLVPPGPDLDNLVEFLLSLK